jgi:tetratricopeptide (TPR) repeat protein
MNPGPSREQSEFRRAVGLYQSGQLDAAEALCAQLLERAPDDVELAHFAGVLANRMDRFELAIDRLSRCIRRDPSRTRAHAALGLALERSGRFDDAIQAFAAAIRSDPAFAEAHNGLGVSFHGAGRLREAVGAFERALALDPGSVPARLNMAKALQQLGRSEAAAQRYREALALAGDRADVLRLAASGLQEAGDFQAAADALRRILATQPGDTTIRCQLALALNTLRRRDEARAELDLALSQRPPSAFASNTEGVLMLSWERGEAAAAAFRRALDSQPHYPEARINLAIALLGLGRRDEALREIAQVRSEPGLDAVALSRVGVIYSEHGASGEALEVFDAAIAMNPLLPEPHIWLSSELLGSGNLRRGWEEYLYRPTRGTEVYAVIAKREYPPALPRDLHGKDLVLLGEQGLGDILFFMRYASALVEAGARLHVRADRRLEPLVRRAMPIASWFDGDELPPHAAFLFMGDLPLVTRDLGAEVAASLRFEALPERMERMRARLEALARPLVGIAWRAGTPELDRRIGHNSLSKAVPVDVLADCLAQLPGAFINLQRHPDPAATAVLSDKLGGRLHDFSDVNEDLEDMVALQSLLDDYIGVSSTNVHLRAAVGGAGHVLVPSPADWRWQKRGASPFFPAFKAHRQTPGGDWSAALEELRRDIR